MSSPTRIGLDRKPEGNQQADDRRLITGGGFFQQDGRAPGHMRLDTFFSRMVRVTCGLGRPFKLI